MNSLKPEALWVTSHSSIVRQLLFDDVRLCQGVKHTYALPCGHRSQVLEMKGSQIFTADRQLFIAQVKFLEKLLDPVFCAAGTKRKADSCGHLSCFTGSTQPWQAHAYHPGTSLFCSKPCHAHINANIARARTGTDAQTGRNFMKGFLKIKTCLSLLMV